MMKPLRKGIIKTFWLLLLVAAIGFTLNSGSRFFTGIPITGHVSLDTGQPEAFTEEDITERMTVHDEDILSACKEAHHRSGDCFNILKSIMSVTSRGDSNYAHDGMVGFIPLETTEVRTSAMLKDLKQNLAFAAEDIMLYYDVYNGDITFTLISYYAGRSLTNAIMYEMQRDIKNSEKATKDLFFSVMKNAYPAVAQSVDNIPGLDDIEMFYEAASSAYKTWTGKPIIESTADQLVYEYGTYSIRPSFEIALDYNITKVKKMQDLLETFFSYASEIELDADYRSLESYVREEGLGTISGDHFEAAGLDWHKGSCTGDGLLEFASQVSSCLESLKTDCTCDLSAASVPDGLRIVLRNAVAEEGSDLTIAIYQGTDLLESIVLRQSPASQMTTASKTLFGGHTQNVHEELTLTFSPDGAMDVYAPTIYKQASDEDAPASFTFMTEDALGFIPEGTPSCGISYHELICVEDPETKFYNQESKEYEPVRYIFALS